MKRLPPGVFTTDEEIPSTELHPSDIAQILDRYLTTRKRFLRNEYNIWHLSEDTGIPVNQISHLINEEKKMSFNDFIDRYRINYCLEFLQRAPIRELSMFDLSVICGFPNPAAFSRSFKKVTRSSPLKYIKNLRVGGV